MMILHQTELEKKLHNACTKRMLKSVGYHYLTILWLYPNQLLSCLKLYKMLHPDDDTEDFDCLFREKELGFIFIYCDKPELALKPYDRDTRKILEDYLISLQEKEETLRRNHDLARLADLRAYKKKVVLYLQDKLIPKDKHCNSADMNEKATHAVTVAIWNFLKRLEKKDPELAAYIRRYLTVGCNCMWQTHLPDSQLIAANFQDNTTSPHGNGNRH